MDRKSLKENVVVPEKGVLIEPESQKPSNFFIKG